MVMTMTITVSLITLHLAYRTGLITLDAVNKRETEQQHISRRIDCRDDMLSDFQLI